MNGSDIIIGYPNFLFLVENHQTEKNPVRSENEKKNRERNKNKTLRFYIKF